MAPLLSMPCVEMNISVADGSCSEGVQESAKANVGEASLEEGTVEEGKYRSFDLR